MPALPDILKPVFLCFKSDEKKLDIGQLKKVHEELDLISVQDSESAIEVLKNRQVALLVSSLSIDGMDGIEFFSQAKRISPYTLRVLLNIDCEPDLIVRAINRGKVWKCITWPWKPPTFTSLVQDGLELWKIRRKSEERPSLERTDFFLQLLKKITDLLNRAEDIELLLRETVTLIGKSLGYDVVSIYLWDNQEKNLVMRSNTGLKVNMNSPVVLRSGEGLTGHVFQSKRSLIAMPASRHAHYKYFPKIGEDQYESYLGVPVLMGNKPLGVLVAQIHEEKLFSPAEEILFQLIASRLAGMLDLADRIVKIGKNKKTKYASHVYQGRGVSPGYACGQVYLLQGLFKEVSLDHLKAHPPGQEIDRLKKALRELEVTQAEMISGLVGTNKLSRSEIKIFKTHLMIMQDATLLDNISTRISRERSTAEQAIVEEFESLAGHFEKQEDPYFKERGQDFRDIGEKLLQKLLFSRGEIKDDKRSLKGAVIVGKDISPSLLPSLFDEKVAAIVTETGGVTSHASILAKSLGIPAVVGVENITSLVKRGDELLVDGKTGLVFVHPDKNLQNEYAKSHKKQTKLLLSIEKEIGQEKPRIDVEINANVGFPTDVDLAVKHGLQNVGLMRTEFYFMRFDRWPTVSQQASMYEDVAKNFSGQITLRTLDIGADKMLPYFKFPKEENPMLGLRSIRFSMEYLDFFRDQIKAVVLAMNKGFTFRILLPMVTRLWELETAREILMQIGEELDMPEGSLPKLGIMAEVPGVVYQLEDYKKYIDFISIGTNDLVQYILAVDRNSSVVGHLYSEFHPAVIRTLNDILQKGRALDLEVSTCGESAGKPTGALILLALGCRHFSVLPSAVPVLRFLISRLTPEVLTEVKKIILVSARQKDIESYLNEVLESLAPQLLETE